MQLWVAIIELPQNLNFYIKYCCQELCPQAVVTPKSMVTTAVCLGVQCLLERAIVAGYLFNFLLFFQFYCKVSGYRIVWILLGGIWKQNREAVRFAFGKQCNRIWDVEARILKGFRAVVDFIGISTHPATTLWDDWTSSGTRIPSETFTFLVLIPRE